MILAVADSRVVFGLSSCFARFVMLYRPCYIFIALVAAVLMTVAPSLSGQSSANAARENASAAKQGPTKGTKSKGALDKVASSKGKAKKGKAKKSVGKKRKTKRRKRGKTGHNVTAASLRKDALERPSGNVWVYTENLHEEVKVNIYDDNGDFNDEALALLDHEFRCRRTREKRAFDPRLYETLSRLQDHFDGKRIHLVSGFRFQRNEGSRHYHASAADIRIPGVSIRKLQRYASSLDRGGMGIGLYPNSNFVHVDFRAPGEPSYRWVDRSRRGSSKASKGKRRSRRSKRRRPNT